MSFLILSFPFFFFLTGAIEGIFCLFLLISSPFAFPRSPPLEADLCGLDQQGYLCLW